MPHERVVLVTNSTGNIGKAAVKALLAHHDIKKVKAAGRDAAKTALAHLGTDGIATPHAKFEAVVIDESPDSFKEALHGVDAVFVVAHGGETRGDDAARDVNAIAQHAHVKYVLILGLIGNGDAPDILFSKQFAPLEAAAAKLPQPHTVMRLPFFQENAFLHLGSIKGMRKMFAPVSGDAKYHDVNVSDVGHAAANLLASHGEGFIGTWTATANEPTSLNEIAAAFTKAIGEEVTFVQVPADAAKTAMEGLGIPPWQAGGIVELWDAVTKGQLKPDGHFNLAKVLGRKPTTSPELVQMIGGLFK